MFSLLYSPTLSLSILILSYVYCSFLPVSSSLFSSQRFGNSTSISIIMYWSFQERILTFVIWFLTVAHWSLLSVCVSDSRYRYYYNLTLFGRFYRFFFLDHNVPTVALWSLLSIWISETGALWQSYIVFFRLVSSFCFLIPTLRSFRSAAFFLSKFRGRSVVLLYIDYFWLVSSPLFWLLQSPVFCSMDDYGARTKNDMSWFLT